MFMKYNPFIMSHLSHFCLLIVPDLYAQPIKIPTRVVGILIARAGGPEPPKLFQRKSRGSA